MTHPSNLEKKQWQLKALTEVLGDLVLEVDNTLTIGRGKDNDIVLGSKQISRQHAELNVLNGELFVKDLGSANGTLVNDVKIEASKSKQLNLNDKVSFASLAFEVCQAQYDKQLQQQTSEVIKVSSTVSAPVSEQSDADEENLVTQPVVTPKTAHKSSENNLSVDKVESVAAETRNYPYPVDNAKTDEQTKIKEPTKISEISSNEKISADDEPYPVSTEDVGTITDAKLEEELEGPVPIGDPNQSAHREQGKPINKPEGAIHTRADDESSAEHFKELAEEADPEVLRAKQAAAAKFSGTVDVNHDEPQSTFSNEKALSSDSAINRELSQDASRGVSVNTKPTVTNDNNESAIPQNQSRGKGKNVLWIILILIIIAIAIVLFNSGTLN